MLSLAEVYLVNYLKKTRGEIWPKCSEKKQQKNYQDVDKKSTINKKLILRSGKFGNFNCVPFSRDSRSSFLEKNSASVGSQTPLCERGQTKLINLWLATHIL